MPEYLAPGVYVEEVETGNKPIEGVSTSTAGMVGVTERGPENVPVLVTSVGDYARTFGGRLDLEEAINSLDGVGHGYLPHAVEGFFTNGGRRAYVVRVMPEDANRAFRHLHDRGLAGVEGTVLLRALTQDTGSTVNPPAVVVADATGLADGDSVRIGNGSRAEYRTLDAPPEPVVAVNQPFELPHDATSTVEAFARSADAATFADPLFQLQEDANADATSLRVELDAGPVADLALLAAGQLIEVGPANAGELRFIANAAADGPNVVVLTLDTPIRRDHAAEQAVTVLELPPATPQLAAGSFVEGNEAGASILVLDDASDADFANHDNLVLVDTAGIQEVRRIGFDRLALDVGLYETMPAGVVVDAVEFTRTATNVAGDVLTLDNTDGLEEDQIIRVNGNQVTITGIAGGDLTVAGAHGLANGPAAEAVTLPEKTLTAAVAPGAQVISLNNRIDLEVGDLLRIAGAADDEIVTIAAINGERRPTPDAGSLVLTQPLRADHAGDALITPLHTPTAVAGRQPTSLHLEAAEGTGHLLVRDGRNYQNGDIVRIRNTSGGASFHLLSADAVAVNPDLLVLDEAARLSHDTGLPVVERNELIRVEALDRGDWGNRLRLSVEDEENGLASRAEVRQITLPDQLRLSTLTGIEAGSVLELFDATSGNPLGPLLKVASIDRTANNLVVLDTANGNAMTAAQQAAVGNLEARSREFRLTVHMMQRPDPAVPSRNDTVIDSEMFRHLSMDPRHSRHVETVVGSINGELRLWDRRPEGESRYVRVLDEAADDNEARSIRLGPEALRDVLPSGRTRAARHALSEGSDSIVTMAQAVYLGIDSDEPELRTGIHALTNIRDLSLVAVPGQTSAAVQQALIDHCEILRYRFAVLDGQAPTRDTIADVQNQRQRFDTKYAALYHPWLMIPEPMPGNLASIGQVPIPPSGHMLGIYARSDNERGVHKAPANEPVRGITGLARSLNQGEHDVLNPSPVNINVVRDFRSDNRGIRVWGARCITSDNDYKYVNVRRLLIFLEDSMDRGMQWVVFEPNSDHLWARVRRSLYQLPTSVWRNGALRGGNARRGLLRQVRPHHHDPARPR